MIKTYQLLAGSGLVFEVTSLERTTLRISNLEDRHTLPVYRQTVLKDGQGKRLSDTNLSTLAYLFRFLDAYDFSSEGREEVQHENKTLITASVLGLIFEKINGYKDGSFFTPGFITMYMSREAIRRAVTQKFNEAFDLELNSFAEVKNFSNRNYATDFIQQANEIVDGLTICDPAVGSGHFLVSALNELLTIKSELGVLADREYNTLPVRVAVVNDELIVSERNGEFFAYLPGVADSQRIQETLFHEKEKLIERCLFGVDINTNSVKICRLRLWIELLKNAYYTPDSQYTELETLPNIDINIKAGNSLLYRFDLKEDLSEVFRKQKFKLSTYKDTVAAYKHTRSREEKEQFLDFIQKLRDEIKTEVSRNDPLRKQISKHRGELVMLDNNINIFGETIKDPEAVKLERKRLTKLIEQKEQKIAEIENNKLYQNAFEWRFEFPEVLDDKGNFTGFDIVIGNPPYGVDFSKSAKQRYKELYDSFSSIGESYVLFLEKALDILKNSGHLGFIIPDTILNLDFTNAMRSILIEKTYIIEVDSLPSDVFADPTVDTVLLFFRKRSASKKYHNEDVLVKTFRKKAKIEDLDSPARSFYTSVDLWSETGSFNVQSDQREIRLTQKIDDTFLPLYTFAEMFSGVKAYEVGKGTPPQTKEIRNKKPFTSNTKESDLWLPFFDGKDIGYYQLLWKENNWIKYGRWLATPRAC